jgi:predicted SprT family Zn-dependent metalloprotease
MNIEHCEKKAKKLMQKHNLLDWTFCFDNAKRRFGCAHFRTQTITLSACLVELNNEETVTDVILHEIAHALVGSYNGHNRIFKLKCVEIGCSPRRAYDSATVIQPAKKFIAICPECKKEWAVNKRVSGWHKVCHKRLGDACAKTQYRYNTQ